MWIITNSGKRVDLIDPKPEQIDINDIAHALSGLVRWNAQGSLYLTVAEHSVRVSQLLENQGAPTYIQLWGLLHDAHESYIGDISTPMKRVIDAWSEGHFHLSIMAAVFDETIVEALGLTEVHDAHSGMFAQVHQADEMTGDFERGVLFPDHKDYPIEDWVKKTIEQRGKAPPVIMSPAQAKAAFVTRYAQLRQKALMEFEARKLEERSKAEAEKKAKKKGKKLELADF